MSAAAMKSDQTRGLINMSTTPKSEFRELDRRKNDGIEVTLLWNSHTDRVSVAVHDERSGESFEFEVDSGDALAAFQHPFAYAQAWAIAA
jgi:hypothetical protein